MYFVTSCQYIIKALLPKANYDLCNTILNDLNYYENGQLPGHWGPFYVQVIFNLIRGYLSNPPIVAQIFLYPANATLNSTLRLTASIRSSSNPYEGIKTDTILEALALIETLSCRYLL